jgi:hypothetical protein
VLLKVVMDTTEAREMRLHQLLRLAQLLNRILELPQGMIESERSLDTTYGDDWPSVTLCITQYVQLETNYIQFDLITSTLTRSNLNCGHNVHLS